MLITLPTQTLVWDEESKNLIHNNGELKVKINNSALAHLKWEREFQDAKDGIDFMSAIEDVQRKVNEASKNTKNLAKYLGEMLRILYCFIESEDVPRFIDFVELVGNNPEPIIKKLKNVLDENAKVSAKN